MRRLILDGAVAQRHADQRQAAIDRLQEREEELRAERAEAEADASRHGSRELEAEAAAPRDGPRPRDPGGDRAPRRSDPADAADAVAAACRSVARIDQRTERPPSVLGSIAGRGRPRHGGAPVAGRAARAGRHARRPCSAAVRLPQQAIRRSGARAPGRRQPGPTVKSTGDERSARLGSRPAGSRRPPSRRSVAAGRSTDARRPRPCRRPRRWCAGCPTRPSASLRRGWQAMQRTQHARADRAGGRRRGAEAAADAEGPAAPALEGRATSAWWPRAWTATPRGWSCARAAPARCATLARRAARRSPTPAAAGRSPTTCRTSPTSRRSATAATATWCCPKAPAVVPPADRAARPRRAHLPHRRRRAGAGAVFDLADAADAERAVACGRRSTQLAAGSADRPPSSTGPARPGRRARRDLATFTPPAGDRLPYLDHSVDVVVVDQSRDRRRGPPRRRLGVDHRGGRRLGRHGRRRRRRRARARDVAAPRVLVWSSASTPTPLGGRAGRAGRRSGRRPASSTARSAAGLEQLGDHDVVVVVEPHVLPLPGAIEAAAAPGRRRPATRGGRQGAARRRPARVGRRHGVLRPVGRADRGRSPDVRAPVARYVRPVCWARGSSPPRAPLSAVPAPPATSTGRAFLREWCAARLGHGGSVVYQPDGRGRAGRRRRRRAVDPRWSRRLAAGARPAPAPGPTELGDGAWRYLLAHDDVEACRG